MAKEEPVENAPAKPTPSGPSRGTPPAKPSKGKRKLNDGDSKKPSSSVQKKVKTENVRFLVAMSEKEFIPCVVI